MNAGTSLSTVAVAAVLGLVACGPATPSAPSPSVETSPPPSVGIPAPAPPEPGGPPLPQPSALTDVMARLADPAVPGAQKVALIENGTAGEAAGLDRFAAALRDNGSLPLTFEARDLAWSQNGSGNVVATVTVTSANPQTGRFMYPMEFVPADGSWRLTRQTADQLLALDAPPPAPPPAPAPTPTP